MDADYEKNPYPILKIFEILTVYLIILKT